MLVYVKQWGTSNYVFGPVGLCKGFNDNVF